MKNKLYLCFLILGVLLSSCDKKEEAIEESPFKPFDGNSDDIPANCNVKLVSLNRITANEVTENLSLGDYIFTLKSVKTEKEKISIEGRYAKNGTAAAIVTVSVQSVGIDETIEIKISSNDIKTEEDFDCMEYVVKVKVKDSSNCEYTSTDC